MSDGFKNVTFRIDEGSRSATLDSGDTVHYGDSLVMKFCGVAGIDPDTATLGLFAKTAGNYSAAVSVAAGNILFSPGTTDTVYCLVSLLTSEVKKAVDAVLPGSPAVFRIYLRDAEATFLDQDIEVYPSPLVSASPSAPGDVYVTAAQIKAVTDSVAAMPTLTAAQREARFAALLTLLGGL